MDNLNSEQVSLQDADSFVTENGTIASMVKRLGKFKTTKLKPNYLLNKLMTRSRSKFNTDKNELQLYKEISIRNNHPSLRNNKKSYTTKTNQCLSIFSRAQSDVSSEEEITGVVKLVDFDGDECSFEQNPCEISVCEDNDFVLDQKEIILFSLAEIQKMNCRSDWSLKHSQPLFKRKKFTLVLELDKIFTTIRKSNGKSASNWGYDLVLAKYFYEFFEFAEKHFNLVVYSACIETILQQILNLVDSVRFDLILGREHCRRVVLSQGQEYFVKDLSLFSNLNKDNVLIVDTNPIAFANDLDNGILVNDIDQGDELRLLKEYLQNLLKMPGSLRKNNATTFKLKQLKKKLIEQEEPNIIAS